MLRKTLSFLASLFAVALLLGSQNVSKADGNIYVYALSGPGGNVNAYTIAYGVQSAGVASGYIYVYMTDGNFYNGFVTTVNIDAAAKTGTITSVGYWNGYYLTTSIFNVTQNSPDTYTANSLTSTQSRVWDLQPPYIFPYAPTSSSKKMLDTLPNGLGTWGYTLLWH